MNEIEFHVQAPMVPKKPGHRTNSNIGHRASQHPKATAHALVQAYKICEFIISLGALEWEM